MTVSTSPMIGRGEQLARLNQIHSDTVASGRSNWAMVAGDAGMGKTTLINAFLGQAAGAQIATGQCVPLAAESLPYAPIAQLLRELMRAHGRDQIFEWAGAGWESLGSLIPGDTGYTAGDVDRLRLFEAVTVLLERVAGQTGLIAVIEDLHWCDESTRHLLRFIRSALVDAPVFVIVTYRADEMHRNHPLRPWISEFVRLSGVHRIDLPPLPVAEATQLATSLLTGRREDLIDPIVDRAEGVPYFIEELARSLAAGGELPWTLRDALLVRVHALAEETQRVLRLASGAGTRVDHDLLATVADIPPDRLDVALREATDAWLLTADERGYAFRHALVQEAVHEDLLPGEYARLHARYARAYQANPQWVRSGQLAAHLFAAGELDAAFAEAIRVGRLSKMPYLDRLRMLEKALEIWDRVAEPEAYAGPRDLILHEAAFVAQRAGEFERGLALSEAGIASLGPETPPTTLAERETLRGRLLFNVGRPESIDVLRNAVERTANAEPGRQRLHALESLAQDQMLRGECLPAIDTADEVIRLADTLDEPFSRANAMNTKGVSLCTLGRETEGLDWLNRVVDVAAHGPRVMQRYYINLSNDLALMGRYADAIEAAQQGMEVAKEFGLERSLGAMLAGNAAEPMLDLGRWEQALKLVERALELRPAGSYARQLKFLRARIHVWRGESAAAERIIAPLRGETAGIHLPQNQAMLADAEIRHRLLLGESDPDQLTAAVQAAQRVFDAVTRHKGTKVWSLATLAARAVGSPGFGGDVEAERARLRTVVAQAYDSEGIAPWQIMFEAEMSGRIGTWERAYASPVVRRAQASLWPHAGEMLARGLLTTGDRTRAREVIREASEVAQRIGELPLQQRLAELAQRTGFGASDPHPALTKREREVLQLVALGKSNGEIATELFITAKTASVHVSNILTKLGVTSRGEAAAMARNNRLL